jgi:hypothetical protein
MSTFLTSADILLNDRLDLDLDDGYDVITPEQYQPSEWPTRDGKRVRWEACPTFSGPSTVVPVVELFFHETGKANQAGLPA